MKIEIYEVVREYQITFTEEEFAAILERDRQLIEEENFNSLLTNLALELPRIDGSFLYHADTGPNLWFKLKTSPTENDKMLELLANVYDLIMLYINED